ncbi:MAG: twin-arginine translocase subunit TatC [Nitrospiraceae bacterium]|nr:MAG: twin-arginine translocase subunit TatC [Nitrospiraceae bacterium]
MDKAPLTEHLYELRNRIVVSLVAVSITFGFCFSYSENIFSILTLPLHNTINFSLHNPFISFVPTEKELSLVFLAPAEALWMHLKIALISACIISSPIIFHQVWKFIAPGLKPKEKKFAIPFIFVTTNLFLIGALFCFLIVLPFAVNFLMTYKTENIKPMLSAEKYIDFCLKFILAFGAVFELPVLQVFLTRMGILTTDFLAKNRKYAVLLAFVAAALLTPTPDAFNQSLMAVPIVILYEAGIWASRIINRKKKEEI